MSDKVTYRADPVGPAKNETQPKAQVSVLLATPSLIFSTTLRYGKDDQVRFSITVMSDKKTKRQKDKKTKTKKQKNKKTKRPYTQDLAGSLSECLKTGATFIFR